MKILTSSEMREIDRKTIEEIGIPGVVLMENAGLQVYRAILSKFPSPEKEAIVVVAGKGNNGGDGLVVARHLFNRGCSPRILLLASKGEVAGDAALNLRAAERIGLKIEEIKGTDDWRKWKIALSKASLIIDAIFGTGLVKPLEGLFSQIVDDINRTKAFKLAVDIPSGLSADSFQVMGPAVKADLTVTLAAPKIAHVFPPAEELIGELVVADIGIPPALLTGEHLKLDLLEEPMIRPLFRKRKKDGHKGNYGHLLVISGSLGKTGAAALAGKSALRTGAGLVTVGTPLSCLPIVARSMDELMTEPLAETPEKTISERALDRAVELLEGKNALVVGPGISTHHSTAKFLFSFLRKIQVPVVIDADGLNIISGRMGILNDLRPPTVLTPHPGEFARLLNLTVPEVLAKKLELAPWFAEKFGVFLVLKGYRTLVASPDGKVFVNPTGNPGMASAGTGDVLSGMIGSFLMQAKDPLGAVQAAVFLHGLSADLAAEKTGEKALTAGDIIRFLPKATRDLENP